jgi:hypothetical protein
MAKTFVISTLLIIIIVILIIIAVQQPTTIVTKPVPQFQEPPQEDLTPRAPVIQPETPTQKAPEPAPPLAPGVKAEKIYPAEINFWVNEIRVPPSTTYQEGLNFIPIKDDQLKTFAGSFGPYFEDPTPYIHVILCAELYKVQAAPACEIVPIIYRNGFVSFARGYQFDEYIGGQAAKDYIAYYGIFLADTRLGESNRAVIRTVKG